MIAAWEVFAQRLACTIGEEDTAIVSKHGIANRRLYADTRGTSGHKQVFGPASFECGIQLSAIEATEAMLVEDELTLLRRQFRKNVRVPGVPDEDTTGGAIRCRDRRPNPGEMSEPVGRIRRTCIGEIGLKAHLDVDHRDFRLPRGGQQACGRSDGPLNHGDVNPSAVEHPPFGPKVILHVDDQHAACAVSI